MALRRPLRPLRNLRDAISQLEADPRIKAEEKRIKAAGVDPSTLLTTILGIVMAFFGGGGAGGFAVLVELVLSFLKTVKP